MLIAQLSPSFNPRSLFTGVAVGGLYIASSPGNTLAQWNDLSGLGNHLVQATANDRFSQLVPRYNGLMAYQNYDATAGLPHFTLPAINTNRQSFSIWCIYRMRSNIKGSDNSIVSFGPGVTDCLMSWAWTDATGSRFRCFGTSAQVATTMFGNTSLTLSIVSSSASGVTVVSNDVSATLPAFTAGSVVGGRAFARNDPGYPLNGEVYEFGFIDRPLTAAEIAFLQSRYHAYYNPQTQIGQVVVVGDSLTQSQNGNNVMSWSTAIDDVIGDRYTMRNMGSGATYAMAGGGGNTWTPAHYNSAAMYNGALSKNIFICWLGTNDIVSLVNAATLQTGIHAITDPARAAGFKVVVCTITPRDDIAWTPAFETERTTYNAAILADPNFDAVVDLASVSQLSNPNDTTYYSSDKLHHIDAGIQVIGDTIRPVILSL